MKRALSSKQTDELQRAASTIAAEGTYGAVSRNTYPKLNPPSPDCGGAQLTRQWTQEQLTKAEAEYALNPTYANKCRVKCLKMLMPLFIDEIETIQ